MHLSGFDMFFSATTESSIVLYLNFQDLETAASYLLILQNLEPPSVAQNHATLLLDAALDSCSWELAKELVRFLRTIGETCLKVNPKT